MFASWTGDADLAARRGARGGRRLAREAYLILDQFEEYFLYHAGEEGAGTFAEELPELLGRTERRVNVLISVREDALARLDALQGADPERARQLPAAAAPRP